LMVKYYPNAELVDTVFSGAASPTWKSIVYGLELLKEGTNMEIPMDSTTSIQETNPDVQENSAQMGISAHGTRETRMGYTTIENNPPST
jgi:hypothetical protein